MIGKIYSSITPFYDSKKCINSFKRRPVLIIGGPRNNDYTILPVSTITRKENIDPDFDVKVEPEQYPNFLYKNTQTNHSSSVLLIKRNWGFEDRI